MTLKCCLKHSFYRRRNANDNNLNKDLQEFSLPHIVDLVPQVKLPLNPIIS